MIPLTENLKVVTILFVDIVESAWLTAQVGTSIAADLTRRCHALVRNAVIRHGGACGRWAGDGVMAVFGVPTLNDDDALRAARAAVQITTEVATLSEEFSREHGLPVEIRIGINTGQALVRNLGPVEDQVAGLTPIIARRLETAAKANDILIGDTTYKLIQEWVKSEPVSSPLLLKGIPEPVPAWRLDGIEEGQPGTRPDGPLIGRSRDLTLLLHLLDRVTDDQTCHVVTVVGQPGIGKSRLVREFERQVGDVTLLRSACLPYGESITFWPILDMIRQAAGVKPDDSPARALERLDKLTAQEPDGRRIARRVGQLLGWVADTAIAGTTDLHDLHRALSRLFQVLARERTLVLVFDDLHLAEQGLLDCIHEIASNSSNAPIMLICVARPELIEDRSAWLGGLVNTSILGLAPFDERNSDRLVKHLLQGKRMPDELELLDYVQRHAQGNPLFMESYLAMLRERQWLIEDDGQWKLTVPLTAVGEQVPPKLQLVISARLERLEAPLRTVLERAAVVGGQFHAANIVALSPNEPPDEVLTSLEGLARKGLILRDPKAAAKFKIAYGKLGYRFRHMLYRDVAYDSLPEERRADLHEQYADWAESNSAEPETAEIQTDEMIAHHLVQAYRRRSATRPDRPETKALAVRAAERLLAAGQRANQRGDLSAALTLLDQAVELLPADHPHRPEAILDLAQVLRESDATRAAKLFEEVERLARRAGDQRMAMHARLGPLDLVGLYTDPEKPLEVGEAIAKEAIVTFEGNASEPADHRGLAKAWRLRGFVQYAMGRNTEAMKSIGEAEDHAREAEDERLEASMRQLGSTILFWGPTPLRSVEPQLERTLSWARRQGSRGLEATALGLLARAAAMGNHYAEARKLNEAAAEIRKHSGEQMTAAGSDSISSGLVELFAGRLEEANQILRQAYDDLKRMGGIGPRINVSILLARTRLLQGALGKAEELTEEVEEIVPMGLIDPRIKWRSIRAVVKARRGEREEAERLIDEAIEMADVIEQPNSRAEAYFDKAEVLQTLGRQAEAAEAAKIAYHLYDEQGNRSAARRVRALIE